MRLFKSGARNTHYGVGEIVAVIVERNSNVSARNGVRIMRGRKGPARKSAQSLIAMTAISLNILGKFDDLVRAWCCESSAQVIG